ncbi:MAG: AAA-like domain-containing protein [Microcoleaceae cyanobacterium]
MTIDELIQLLNASQPSPLTALQELILRHAWDGKTYTVIAQEAFYGAERVRKVAAGLWLLASEVLGEPISKANFRKLLEPRPLSPAQQQSIRSRSSLSSIPNLEFPDSPLAPDSEFYIPRPPIEDLAHAKLLEPGSLIRIKAPRKMGKSSLILHILDRASQENYQIIHLDLGQADSAVFSSLDRFLRWFCANMSRELNQVPNLNEYWDEDIGSKVSCTIYVQTCLLAQLSAPLVLALTEIDRVFEYPEIAKEFLPLLRFWHEQARKTEIWQKLRLIVSYSTEVYIPLSLNQSPFNIGLPLTLPPFTPEQVLELARRYGLTWCSQVDIDQLMGIVGGHPYLIQLALHHLTFPQHSLNPMSALFMPPARDRTETWEQQRQRLQDLLRQAPTEAGIYNDHLRRMLSMVQSDSHLRLALQQVVSSDQGVSLEPTLAYKLNSLGLVNLDGDYTTPSCQLYAVYFRHQLIQSDRVSALVEAEVDQGSDFLGNANPTLKLLGKPEQLKKENLELQQLCNLDELTQLANKRYFDSYLKLEWQRSLRDQTHLSVVLADIDFFKIFNAIYGYSAGDSCLQQIAQTIRDCINRPDDLVARYGGEEFMVLLPRTDVSGAVCVAERIREQIKALGIDIKSYKFGGFPEEFVTVSVGVASTIPNASESHHALIQGAERALHESKRKGRNRVTVSHFQVSQEQLKVQG